jgi:hypothetical protein
LNFIIIGLVNTTISQALKRLNSSNYLRRRWLDFRNGHSIYLVFLMTFANFVTIQYQLLLQRVPLFHSLNISIWDFAVIFVLIYIPLGMIIGYWHRKNQFSVEAEALFSQNQIGATINLFLIDLIDGKVTEEEKQQMRNYLLKIMKRSDRSKLYKEAASSDPRLDTESKVNLQKTE